MTRNDHPEKSLSIGDNAAMSGGKPAAGNAFAQSTVIMPNSAAATSELPVEQRRAKARACLLGAFVADAATVPLHWVYEESDVSDLPHYFAELRSL